MTERKISAHQALSPAVSSLFQHFRQKGFGKHIRHTSLCWGRRNESKTLCSLDEEVPEVEELGDLKRRHHLGSGGQEGRFLSLPSSEIQATAQTH